MTAAQLALAFFYGLMFGAWFGLNFRDWMASRRRRQGGNMFAVAAVYHAINDNVLSTRLLVGTVTARSEHIAKERFKVRALDQYKIDSDPEAIQVKEIT